MIYEQYLGVIDRKADTICAVSDSLWDHPELPFREHASMELLASSLEKEGFTVHRGVGGLPTAFKATYGTGHPAMGILAEYDALSGLNQAANVAEPSCIPGPDVGHGCGHNLKYLQAGTGIMVRILLLNGLIRQIRHPSQYRIPPEIASSRFRSAMIHQVSF